VDDVSQIDLASTKATQGHGAQSQTSSRESLQCEHFKAGGVERFFSKSEEKSRRGSAVTSSAGPPPQKPLSQKNM